MLLDTLDTDTDRYLICKICTDNATAPYDRLTALLHGRCSDKTLINNNYIFIPNMYV